MALSFRNLRLSPAEPVEVWGVEGILTAIDRGSLADWRRIVAAVRKDPWGPVARDLEEALTLAEDRGAVAALMRAMTVARRDRDNEERAEVADELSAIRAALGLSQREFAERLGTSRTRLNTYLSGKVTPSASFMVRARRLQKQLLERR